MIGRLSGKLLEKKPPQLLIDVNGVGYEVAASMSTFYQLPEIGQSVTLFIHLVVREDAQLLYGFAKNIERSLFRLLIKVSGVGPKVALAILSGMEADVFVRCVLDNDSDSLTRVPGIGKKTAQRLVIEMRDKLAAMEITELNLPAGAESQLTSSNSMSQEAISALVALGYKPQEASRAISRVQAGAETSEQLIRSALKSMVKPKSPDKKVAA